MKIYAYGEDALSMWALRHRLDEVLEGAGQSPEQEELTVFFRPSFGRRGGDASAQFGEFDFILLTDESVILGESKWDRSSEVTRDGKIRLRAEQLLRHDILRRYITEWTANPYTSWEAFAQDVEEAWEGPKPLAPVGSLLAENLHKVLQTIKLKYDPTPQVDDMLLYLYDGSRHESVPTGAPSRFLLVPIDYSVALIGNFIEL